MKHCSWCTRAAYVQSGKTWLCKIHYRYQRMRIDSKFAGKQVPSWADLVRMTPKNMECPACLRTMTWTRQEGAGRVATIQHDRCGGMKIICLSCNSAHPAHAGDTFYEHASDERRCSKCHVLKPLHQFHKKSSGRSSNGRSPTCKECEYEVLKIWRSKNRAKINAQGRERARKKRLELAAQQK